MRAFTWVLFALFAIFAVLGGLSLAFNAHPFPAWGLYWIFSALMWLVGRLLQHGRARRASAGHAPD
jgi:hypothetical protein